MVAVATNRIAIDADSPDQVEALGRFEQMVRTAGITPVVVDSGRGRHLFAAVKSAERQMWMSRAKDLGLDARDWIRPPLAPHTTGRPVRLLGCTVEAALAALHPPPKPRQPLSQPKQDLLRGEGRERYETRSQAVQALAVAMYANQWTIEDFRTALTDSRTWQDYVADKGSAWMDLTWRSARRHVDERRTTERREVLRVTTAAREVDWTGPASATLRAVLHAHLAVAHQRGSVRHVLSIADAAIVAGVSNRTAVKARHELQRLGWLRQVTAGGGLTATTWAIERPRTMRSCTPDLTPPQEADEFGCAATHDWWDDLGADAYRHRALGKLGREVISVLAASDEALTAAEIARRCPSRPHPTTVGRRLTEADRLGLVEGAPRDGWRLLDHYVGGLHRIAELEGTAGTREAAISARDRRREARRAARAEFRAQESTGWVKEVAPFLPVPGRPDQMFDPSTGEVIGRPVQPDPAGPWTDDDVVETLLPETYFGEHVRDWEECRNA